MEIAKTLGPASAELLLRLSAEGKTIFSIADAQAITNTTYEATAALLSKLERKRWLVRLVPGKYLIVPLEAGLESIPMADRYVIARQVLDPLPYYISHYSAMELHQMTTQPVNTVYVTVPRQRASRTIAGVEYRFVYANPRSFWGWESIWVTDQEQVRVSDLEKTLLDCAVRPELCGGLAEVAKGLWLRKDDLDEGLLKAIAQDTGGFDSRADDAASLREIVQKINDMEKTKVKTIRYTQYAERFNRWALPALVLLMLEMIASCTVFRKIP